MSIALDQKIKALVAEVGKLAQKLAELEVKVEKSVGQPLAKPSESGKTGTITLRARVQ